MVVKGDPALEAYLAVCDRVATMARGAGAGLEKPVPACPRWTARDVVNHLVGLTEDWVTGNLATYGSDVWTGEQVERFHAVPVEQLLHLWAGFLERFRELPDHTSMGSPGRWAFGDAAVHEADLRPVLAPGTRVPVETAALALRAGVARWRSFLRGAPVPTLRLTVAGVSTWWLGREGDDAAVHLDAEAYELFRALFGRRSREQVAALRWSADPTPYLDAGLPEPFRWAVDPQVD